MYKESLSSAYPDVIFNITDNKQIQFVKNQDTNYLMTDALYNSYLNHKDSASYYLQSFTSTLKDYFESNELKIIPIIRNEDYINYKDKDLKKKVCYDTYNYHLNIVYVRQYNNLTKVLTYDLLDSFKLNKSNFKSIALNTLDTSIGTNFIINKKESIYSVYSTKEEVTSLILLERFWSKDNFPIEGDFVVALPAANELMVVGSKDIEAINQLKIISETIYDKTEYPISPLLYTLKNKKFVEYNWY